MTQLADAFDLIAEGFASAALALREKPPEDAGAPLAPPEDSPATLHGSAAVCPAHNKEYRAGKYGPYCATPSEDPQWSKKGWCSITPASAAAWLRQKAA